MTTNEQRTCTIDDLFRVLIPHSLRKELNWEAGTELTFAVSKKGIELSAQNGGALSLDDFGRVTLSQDLMETMGWKVGCKIAIMPLEIINGVILATL